MIVQSQQKGVVVRIEVIGVTVGHEEKETIHTVAIWLIGFICGSRGLDIRPRQTFNNGVRQLFLSMATTTKSMWQDLLGQR